MSKLLNNNIIVVVTNTTTRIQQQQQQQCRIQTLEEDISKPVRRYASKSPIKKAREKTKSNVTKKNGIFLSKFGFAAIQRWCHKVFLGSTRPLYFAPPKYHKTRCTTWYFGPLFLVDRRPESNSRAALYLVEALDLDLFEVRKLLSNAFVVFLVLWEETHYCTCIATLQQR